MRGGAAGLEGFLEMLKPLRQPLTVQVNDRFVGSDAAMLSCMHSPVTPVFCVKRSSVKHELPVCTLKGIA